MVMFRRLALLCVILLVKVTAARRRCINSGVLFEEKVLRSPIVVYGVSVAKRIYLDSDDELLFNVSFRVDCILKGPAVENRIEITDAGIKIGHKACQWLEPSQAYVVFLEKWGPNPNDYRPLDFQERYVDVSRDNILQRTCGLAGIAPVRATMNRCPEVSNATFCPHDDNDVVVVQSNDGAYNINSRIKSMSDGRETLFQLQSNVTGPRQASILTNIVTTANNACKPVIDLLFVIPLLLATIF